MNIVIKTNKEEISHLMTPKNEMRFCNDTIWHSLGCETEYRIYIINVKVSLLYIAEMNVHHWMERKQRRMIE